MSTRAGRLAAVTMPAFFAGCLALTFGLGAANGNVPGAEDTTLLLAFIAFMGVGTLIVSRRPDNAIGWVFSGIGLLTAVGVAGAEYAMFGFITRPGSLPGAVWGAWLTAWWWYPLLFSVLFLTPLLFPTGRPPSRRWRPVLWVGVAVAAAITVLAMLNPELELEDEVHTVVRNPIGVEAVGDVEESAVGSALFGALVPLFFAGLASVAFRYRRSSAEQRQQLKWFLFAVALLLLVPVGDLFESGWLAAVWNQVFGALVAFLPVSAGIAILRYRLFDIDLVINKTLVYGALGAFITAVYVGVVVGIGSLFGRDDEPNLGLSITATALVAVAFQPVRQRVQHWANRLVYGRRATPYEVLSEFSRRMSGAYAAEDVLPRMARTLGEGTGARQATVWLVDGRDLRVAATWPEDAGLDRGEELRVEVTHQGERLGALSIVKPAGEPLQPAERKLAEDLASQAGLVLRNVRLIEDIKASRARLVAAQDQERRRLERNIHDGAQQQLETLRERLGLARSLAQRDVEGADRMLDQLQVETRAALDDLRDLARGIYPPLLADQGLVAALQAQARRSPVPVTVQADELARYPQEVEAAVYFCVLEALRNVVKYARASAATVELWAADGTLAFEVTDDGVGFDPDRASTGSGLQNMADRLAALGGAVEVVSAPGRGSRVGGRVPVLEMELVG